MVIRGDDDTYGEYGASVGVMVTRIGLWVRVGVRVGVGVWGLKRRVLVEQGNICRIEKEEGRYTKR